MHAALWNSTLKQHQGREEEVKVCVCVCEGKRRRRRRRKGEVGGCGDTQVEISGAVQPVFFSLSFTLVSWKREQKRYTPESRLQSNYFEQ